MSGGTSRAALVLASIAAALALFEGGARIVERARAGDAAAGAQRVDDPVLEYRTVPGTGHDARGFRNAAALARADVVALGDSQTWGENASPDETWPARLAAATGLSVYNMGRGGYGPVQYAAMIDDALALAPRFVVVALYFGNDFYDAWHLAYDFDANARWRHPDGATQARIERADYPDLKRMLFERVGFRGDRPGWLAWLRAHAASFRLAARALAPVDPARDRAWSAAHPTEGFVFDGPGPSTVFHTTYRLAAVDLRLPRIAEGVRITEEALAAIAARVRAAPGSELVVALVPTKERVYAAAIAAAGVETPASYRESVRYERDLARRLDAWLAGRGIARVDLLPALEAAIARGEAIFPSNADGHFTPEGYAVVAGAIADAIGVR